MKIGYQVKSAFEYKLPVVLFFSSRFCSKCMYNSQILQKYLSDQHLKRIDIANSTQLMEELHPRLVPTIVMLDRDARIIYVEEGIIGDKKGAAIASMLDYIS